MMTCAAGAKVSQFLRAAAIGACCPLLAVQAQETPQQPPDESAPMEEIIVVVDRDGRSIDIDALRFQENVLKIIREFKLEQHEQEEEEWRLRLRSAMNRKSSQFAWGYDAQAEAARFRYTQANYLPVDRVRPATIVSIRF